MSSTVQFDWHLSASRRCKTKSYVGYCWRARLISRTANTTCKPAMRHFPRGTALFSLSSFILLRATAFLAAAAAIYLIARHHGAVDENQSYNADWRTAAEFYRINKQTSCSSLRDRRRSVYQFVENILRPCWSCCCCTWLKMTSPEQDVQICAQANAYQISHKTEGWPSQHPQRQYAYQFNKLILMFTDYIHFVMRQYLPAECIDFRSLSELRILFILTDRSMPSN